MKSAAFEYSRPADIDEACALLAADDGARIVAGGQTLVPLMAMRLARPSRLIDIARIPGLAYVRDEGAEIAIGATTKQSSIENDPVVRAKLPLLHKVVPFVGHGPTRARGTVGGSLANGDHSAEIVLVAATLNATLVWREAGADHTMSASEFFLGPMVTALPLAGRRHGGAHRAERPGRERARPHRASLSAGNAPSLRRAGMAGDAAPARRRSEEFRLSAVLALSRRVTANCPEVDEACSIRIFTAGRHR